MKHFESASGGELPPPREVPRPVLHVLPNDVPRGAQAYAQALRDALDGPNEPHLIATIFTSPSALLRPDYCADVSDGFLRKTWTDPRALHRVGQMLRQLRPEFIVAHGAEPLKYVSRWARNFPIAYYAIGLVHARATQQPRLHLYRRTVARATHVVAVSTDVATQCRSLLRCEDIVVIPNGRDPQIYAPREDGVSPIPHLMFVGRLDPGKRAEWFLDIVEQLRAERVELRASLVGDGPQLGRISPRACRLGVRLLGERTDVPSLLREADVLILPSAHGTEGMPGVVIEAGLTGVPVVASDVPGVRDIIVDQTTGFVVHPDDIRAFVESTRQLASSPDLRTTMGRAARDRCAAQFSLDASAQRWRSLIRSAAFAGNERH